MGAVGPETKFTAVGSGYWEQLIQKYYRSVLYNKKQ